MLDIIYDTDLGAKEYELVQCTSSDVIEFIFDQPDFAANASIDN